MSLWTPGGEHDVPDDRPGGATGPDQFADFGDIDPEQLTDEQRAQLEAMAGEMAQVRAQLLSVPASTVVANHAMGLYELAAIHLSSQPPNLDEGRVAIDGMAGVVEALEGRLGENEPVLRDALAQLRLAFVQLQGALDGDVDDEDGEEDDDEA
jgi:Domain of unknown function (DUF1844)